MRCFLIFTIAVTASVIMLTDTYAALNLEFSVIEVDNNSNEMILIHLDNLVIEPRNTYHLFTGPLTISLYTMLEKDHNIHTQMEAVTLGPDIATVSREFLMKPGEDITVTLPGKEKRIYEISIRPHSTISLPIDTTKLSWTSEESIHFNHSYIKDTPIDFHLPYFSAYLESVDKFLKGLFRFYYPGKIGCWFFNERSTEVYWDKSFPVSLDPARKRMAIIYDRRNLPRTATLLTVYLLYYNWGYSHPFAVWGAAGCFDIPHFDAAKMYSTGIEIDPAAYFKPRPEWKGDPDQYLPFIASFTKYIIDKYGVEKFKSFYRDCSDLTDIKAALLEHFGDSYESIKQNWQIILSKYDPGRAEIGYYAELQFDYLNDYKRALPFYAYIYTRDQTHSDSGVKFAMSMYNSGDYSGSSDVYGRLIRTLGESAEYRYLLGNSYYSAGDYDKAEKNYTRALEIDTTYSQAYYKLGDIYLKFGRNKEAEKKFMYALGWAPEGGIYSEIYLGWASSFRSLGNVKKADSLSSLGLYFAKTKVASQPKAIVFRMLLGEAFVFSNQPDSALSHLNLVLPDENRNYYIGRTYLALGKTYDLLNQRETAREYYQKVLENKSAAYNKRDARILIEKPYRRP